MRPGFPQNQSITGSVQAAREDVLGDVAWGRPVFRPPLLPNPRVIFDPLPFRSQLFNTLPRPVRR
jgi:hypothetical protein